MLVERLQKQTGLSLGQLERFADTASKRYKVYEIPKRTGGVRVIEHPSRELKALQRWLDRRLVRLFDVHESATAYRKGSNIRANAMRHVATHFTLRLDFKDFFPSFTIGHIRKFLEAQAEAGNAELDDADISFASRIFCRNDKLTIGAPTSPSLTNAMMFGFDHAMANLAAGRELIYSRYADDLFVSSYAPNALDGLVPEVKALAKKFPYAKLRTNDGKTAFLSRRYRRSITGLIVTPDGRVSIGRDRKREIKALVHQFQIGTLPEEALGYLQGMLAFAGDCDPPFAEALTEKYGSKTLKQISAT